MKEKLKRGFPYSPAKLLFSLVFVLFFSATTYSQSIKGRVTDENNQPVAKVTVQVKNTNRATVTDDAGRYSINASPSDVIVFSHGGAPTREETVGNRNNIDVRLTGNLQNLSEVIVTALGIKKQERGLGYAATNVNPDELTVNRTPNVMNSLQGKVAGVNISSLGTGPGVTT
jgi:hypothetical protein